MLLLNISFFFLQYVFVCAVQVTSCFWNSDQSLLATCSQDKVVQLWSVSQNTIELHTTFSCVTRSLAAKSFFDFFLLVECWTIMSGKNWISLDSF